MTARNPEPHTTCSQCRAEIREGEIRYRQACETCGKVLVVCRLCVDMKAARPDIISIGCSNHPGYMA